MLHHCNIRKRTGTYKLHIRLGINIVLLGGGKGIDTKVEGGVEILIVNSSLPGLEQSFTESRQEGDIFSILDLSHAAQRQSIL